MSGAPLFTLVIFMKVDNIVNVCVKKICFILFNLLGERSEPHTGVFNRDFV